ncbi:MAG TPA: DUF6754 domain-containing protein [Anaerolineales bacterium]|nr:DUF6754 domain-containing protein [Anaerolineales bacterium]
MTFSGTVGLIVVIAFFILIIAFAARGRGRPSRNLRDIPAFARLGRAVGNAVEAGTRLHVSLGSGDLVSFHSAVAFMGLSMLRRVARATSISDKPPVATAGEGAIAILSQDTLRSNAREMRIEFDPLSGRLVGLTPFSYAAGALSVVHDEDVGANVLVGNFGSEVALINEAGERSGSLTLAGTDDVPGQAVLYATAQEALIGEETFAGGAYLGAGPMHLASLQVQDIIRWVLILAILAGSLLKLVGIV